MLPVSYVSKSVLVGPYLVKLPTTGLPAQNTVIVSVGLPETEHRDGQARSDVQFQ